MQHKSLFKLCALLCAAILIVVLFIPSTSVSAASYNTYNYLDYITNVRVDDELNIVTVSLPITEFRMDIWNDRSDEADTFFNVSKANYYFDPFTTYTIKIEPGTKDYLYVGNIPLDTEIDVYIDVSSYDYNLTPDIYETIPIPSWYMDVGSVDGHFYFYDLLFKRLPEVCDYDVSGGYYEWPESSDEYSRTYGLIGFLESDVYEFIKLKKAAYFRPAIFLDNVTFSDNCDVTFMVPKYELTFHINSLLVGGEYGEVLGTINDHLASQGKYIDPKTGDVKLINSSHFPGVPTLPDQGSVNDSLSGMDEVVNSNISDGKLDPDLSNIDLGLTDNFPLGAVVMLCAPFQILWDNSLFLNIFIIIFTICLSAYFFFGKRG